MGMAASQARFLGLTARKNNVEYEGQQINQQRTSLANQSANYYNDLLGMSVPTPPSVADYTKTVYSFNDGALTNQITSMFAQSNGMFSVSYLSSYVDDFSPVMGVSSIVTTLEDPNNKEDLYNNFVKGTAGGCYSELLDKSNDNNNWNNQINNITIILRHMLPVGNYTTSDGNSVAVYNGHHFWDEPDPEQGLGDGVIMDEIARTLDGLPIQQQLVDLLYDTNKAYNSMKWNQVTLDSLRDRFVKIVNEDLKAVLSSTYMISNNELRLAGVLTDVVRDNDNSIKEYTGNDPYLKTLSPEQLQNLVVEEKQQIALLDAKYGAQAWMVRYVQNTTTGEYVPYFYSREQIQNATYDENGFSQSTINCYHMGESRKTEEIKNIPSHLEQDSTGRYINITLNPGTANEVTYSLTTSTVTDQDAYDDAMNQYEFDKNKYEQQIQEINAKIEIIQAQDKNLELRLKQLDTEQKAISQEIDAVSNVVQKNVEASFKTFG